MAHLNTVLELSKFRLSGMVACTSVFTYLAAGQFDYLASDFITLGALFTGTWLCSASASTLNQVFERDIDARMLRARTRALPLGKVSPATAYAWAAASSVSGTAVLLAATNPTTAALGAANIALYAGLYTWSKRTTEWNTWIGAIVGAIPPYMGWAAATGGGIPSLCALDPFAYGYLLFTWQIAHFSALSWRHRQDYARGGFKMVACADPDGQRTAAIIWRYSWGMAALPVLSPALGLTSSMFFVAGAPFAAGHIYLAQKFRQERSNENAWRIFKLSLVSLLALGTSHMVFSTRWTEDESGIAHDVKHALRTGKENCVHEAIMQSSPLPSACPVPESVARLLTSRDPPAPVIDDSESDATKYCPGDAQ